MIGFKEKNNEYLVSAWRSKGLYTSGRWPLPNHSSTIKYHNYKLMLRFN